MKKLIARAIACVLVCGGSAFAQDHAPSPSERLDRIGKLLTSGGLVDHYEYGACITNIHACPRVNKDNTSGPDHGPSLPETLDWIGNQLTSDGLVHQFEHEGCQVAIDIMDGTPTYLTWLERQDDKLKRKGRSIFNPTLQGYVDAEKYSAHGHITYLIKDRSNGTSNTPKRVTYYNDAVVMDLSKLKEIKNYVAREDNKELKLYAFPVGPVKIVFPRESHTNTYVAGTGFTDAGTDLVSRLKPFPEPENPKAMFSGEYTLFDVGEPKGMLMLFHSPGDFELNIKLTQAFLHAIDLCEKAKNS